jgi:fluoride exporter
MLLVYIAVGGVLGTLARYAVGGWIQERAGTWLPWGTLAVNAIGSLVLGVVMQATQVMAVSPERRGFLTIGFCGAFTTFSTYSYETVTLLQHGELTRAALYAFGSLIVGLAALALGLVAGQALVQPGG